MEERKTRRDETEIRELKNRLHRLSGQLADIEKMLEEDRYCEDILIQVAAAQAGLQNLGRMILKRHMKTCITSQIQEGHPEAMDEAIRLMEKLK